MVAFSAQSKGKIEPLLIHTNGGWLTGTRGQFFCVCCWAFYKPKSMGSSYEGEWVRLRGPGVRLYRGYYILKYSGYNFVA